MLVTLDKKELNAEERKAPMRDKLAEFVVEVAKANPLFEFIVDRGCLSQDWTIENGERKAVQKMYRVKVFQNGEQLGLLEGTTRYRGAHGREDVYGVESFRINKSRGNRDTTYSKDLKVALRTARKMLVPRANEELINHIDNNVTQALRNIAGRAQHEVRYGVDLGSEVMLYIVKAYHAHLEGKTTVELPVKHASVSDMAMHYTKCERMEHFNNLVLMRESNEGYGIELLPDGQIVCLAYGVEKTVKKYPSMDELPSNVADKLSIFKVLEVGDAYTQFGVKLPDNFYFISK